MNDWPPPSLLAGLCEALIGADPAPASPLPIPGGDDLDRIADFSRGQIDALPRWLFFSLRLGLSVFLLYVLFTRQASFQALPPAERSRIVRSWAYGRFSPARALFRVLRISALTAYCDLPEVNARLGCENSGARAGKS